MFSSIQHNLPAQPKHTRTPEMSQPRLWSQAGLLLQFGCAVHLFTEYVAELTMCIGPSMLPTFNTSGDVVVTEAITPRFGKLERGDVVVAVSPRNPNLSVCKRIIGLEGDRVCINPTKYPREFATVPRNHAWLLGDNLINSCDSRDYGPVPLPLIRSRVIFKIWPMDEMEVVQRKFDPEDWPLEPIAPAVSAAAETEVADIAGEVMPVLDATEPLVSPSPLSSQPGSPPASG